MIINMVGGGGGANVSPSSFGYTLVGKRPDYSSTIYEQVYDPVNEQFYGIWYNSSQFTLYRINSDGSLTRICNNGYWGGDNLFYSKEDGCIYLMTKTSNNLCIGKVDLATGTFTNALWSQYTTKKSSVYRLQEYDGTLYWCWVDNNSTIRFLKLDKLTNTSTSIFNFSFTAGGSNANARLGDYPRLFVDSEGRCFIYSYMYFTQACFVFAPGSSSCTNLAPSYLVQSYSSSQQAVVILPDKDGNALLLGLGNSYTNVFGLYSFNKNSSEFEFRSSAFSYSMERNDIIHLGNERYRVQIRINTPLSGQAQIETYYAIFEQLYTLDS